MSPIEFCRWLEGYLMAMHYDPNHPVVTRLMSVFELEKRLSDANLENAKQAAVYLEPYSYDADRLFHPSDPDDDKIYWP
jgi:hypothetical protein